MVSETGNIAERLGAVRARIAAAAARAGRRAEDVTLVAVSKTKPLEMVEACVQAGHQVFGENYIQEAVRKIEQVRGRWPGLRWHFIGRLQRNKARKAVEYFNLIETLDSHVLAATLNRLGEETGRKVRALVQVNMGVERQKAGVAPEGLADLIRRVRDLEYLEVQGLMAIPPKVEGPHEARGWFRELRRLRDMVEEQEGVELPHLSMGMSNDFEIAIEEGATMVRVGTLIFGLRPPKD